MNKWHCINHFHPYWDFEKEVVTCDDEGYTSLDVRLTFNTEERCAYMTAMFRNNDGNTVDLDGQRDIEWNAALRLIEPDVKIPQELQ